MTPPFAERWVLVGSDDQLPEPSSWFVYASWGRSLLIARDAERRVAAFVNACTHRGTRLCTKPGRGKIQCPYHGWVFGCDGRLLGASRRKGLPEFDDAEYGLAPVRLEQVGRFLFVHGAADPPEGLREQLGDRAAALEELSDLLVETVFELRLPLAASVERALETDAGPGERLSIPPNAVLERSGSSLTVTTFLPLGPGRSLRVSRGYDAAPSRLAAWSARRRALRAFEAHRRRAERTDRSGLLPSEA